MFMLYFLNSGNYDTDLYLWLVGFVSSFAIGLNFDANLVGVGRSISNKMTLLV